MQSPEDRLNSQSASFVTTAILPQPPNTVYPGSISSPTSAYPQHYVPYQEYQMLHSQQQPQQPQQPLGLMGQHLLHQQQFNHLPFGVLAKSQSFDAAGGKIRRPRGELPPLDGTQTPPNASPYPKLQELQKSRSSGSVDRINRLARSGSGLTKQKSSHVEEADEPHGGTFDWLDEFRQAGATEGKPKPIFRACVHCKKAHLACDSERPCKRCIHLGKQDSCVDVEHKKRGRPKLPRGEDGSIVRAPKDEESEEEGEQGDTEKKKGKPKGKGKSKSKKKDLVAGKEFPHLAPLTAPLSGDSSQESDSSSPSTAYPHGDIGDIHLGHLQAHSSLVPPTNYSAAANDFEVLSVHTLDGRFSSVSNEAEQLFGFAPYEMVSRSIYEFVVVEDVEALNFLLSALVDQKLDIQRAINVRFKTKFGPPVSCELTMTVYKSPETGDSQSLICSIRPIGGIQLIDPLEMPLHPSFHLNPMYLTSPQPLLSPHHMTSTDFQRSHTLNAPLGYDEPKGPLFHSPSFDKLSNTLGGMKFNPQVQ